MSKPEPLTLSATMLRDHLAVLSVGWFNDHDVPPRDLSGYQPLIAELGELLDEVGDRPWFLLALEHVLVHGGAVSAREFVNDRYAYTDAAAEQLLRYVWQHLGGKGEPVPDGPAARAKLTAMERREWRKLRDEQTLPEGP